LSQRVRDFFYILYSLQMLTGSSAFVTKNRWISPLPARKAYRPLRSNSLLWLLFLRITIKRFEIPLKEYVIFEPHIPACVQSIGGYIHSLFCTSSDSYSGFLIFSAFFNVRIKGKINCSLFFLLSIRISGKYPIIYPIDYKTINPILFKNNILLTIPFHIPVLPGCIIRKLERIFSFLSLPVFQSYYFKKTLSHNYC